MQDELSVYELFDNHERCVLEKMFIEIFNGLESQGWRRSSSVRGDECRYRALDGSRCPIGWITPDHIYTDSMEYNSVRTLVQSHPTWLEAMNKHWNIDLAQSNIIAVLSKAQQIHDSFAGEDLIKERMLHLARQLNITHLLPVAY